MRLGILVSGRGSNLEAVLEATAAGRLDVEPVLVISNRARVPALAIAARHRVPHRVLRRFDFPAVEARDAAIGRELTRAGVELALLAGYDQLLRPGYFTEYAGRTINVHPSLLPAHGGSGMVGSAVHAAVLAAGDAETGVTIHEVTERLDDGPILARERVPVLPGDDVERLAARVLRVEHRLVVAVLAGLTAELRGTHPALRARGTSRATMSPASGSGRFDMPRRLPRA